MQYPPDSVFQAAHTATSIGAAASAAASGPAGVATMAGAGSAIGLGMLTPSEWGIVGGLIVGLGGLLLQVVLGLRKDQREERLARLAEKAAGAQPAAR